MGVKKVLCVLMVVAFLGSFILPNSAFALKSLVNIDKPDGVEVLDSKTTAETRAMVEKLKGTEHKALVGIPGAVADLVAYTKATTPDERNKIKKAFIAKHKVDGSVFADLFGPPAAITAVSGLGKKGGSTLDEAKRLLASNPTTKTFPFSAEFAQNNGAEMLEIIDQVVIPQKKTPVIITNPGEELSVLPAIQDRIEAKKIYVEPVAPESTAGGQFIKVFEEQGHAFVALDMTLKQARKAVENNEELN